MPRFAKSGLPAKIELPMVPLIDIAFQLLIFVMLSLKIVAAEGNLHVNLPIGAPAGADTPQTSDIKVRLLADAAGNLTQLMLGDDRLGHDDRAFERLNREILKRIGRPGVAMSDDLQVEIDADYELRYEHVLRAVSTCSGRLDSQGHMIRFVEKIKFAPPRKQASEPRTK